MAKIFIDNGKAVFKNREGQKVLVDAAEAQEAALRPDLEIMSPEEAIGETPVETFSRSALNTLALGVPNAIARSAGANVDLMNAATQVNPVAATAGNVAGIAGSLLLPGIGLARAAGGLAGGALGRTAIQGAVTGAQAEAASLSSEKDVKVLDAASRIVGAAATGAAVAGGLSVLAGGAAAASKGVTKLAGKAISAVTTKLDDFLAPIGPAGKAVSKLVGGVAKSRLTPGALSKLAKFSPINMAAGAVTAVSPAVFGALSSAESVAKASSDALKSDYLAVASDGVESGVLGSGATEDAILDRATELPGRPSRFHGDIGEVVEAASLHTPEEHVEAARDAYLAAGASEVTAESMAAFQGRRIAVLQGLKTDGPIDIQRSEKTADAVLHPGEAMKRIGSGKSTNEDLRVLRDLYPSTANAMQSAAEAVIESKLDKKLSQERQRELQRIAGGKHRARLQRFIDNIQQAHVAQDQQQQQNRPINVNMPQQTTGVQGALLGDRG